MSILDQPKYLLFMLFVIFTLTLIGGLCDGMLLDADIDNSSSPWYQLQHGSFIDKAQAIAQMWFWDYPWLSGALEYLAWIPFRIVNIVFSLLIVIGVARLIRELLPIP